MLQKTMVKTKAYEKKAIYIIKLKNRNYDSGYTVKKASY